MFQRHLILAAAVLVAAPTMVSAEPQWGVSIQFGSQGGSAAAYRDGYDRGLRAGLEDARRGNRFDFNDETDYRRGDYGYRSQYGNRDGYRNEFRRGFEAGYDAGYRNRNDGYGVGRGGPQGGPWTNGRGRAYGRYDAAAQQGYADGYEAGLDDGRDGRRFDPISEGRYRSGDRGYNRNYGPRELYKTNYRESFRLGYEDGFNDGRRYDRFDRW